MTHWNRTVFALCALAALAAGRVAAQSPDFKAMLAAVDAN
jgi:hypothetical protein